MFTAFNERDDFSYAFEKIRNAISDPSAGNVYAAINLGIDIVNLKYGLFRQELDAAGELSGLEYELKNYSHCIEALQRYFTGNPSGMSVPDAWIYSHYLQSMHERFMRVAEELADGSCAK